ncbi:MAG TPA: helix-turn-helix domain-containing protein [Actinomycetota bacterium]
MISRGEDVEAHALHERGWSISAIARHLGRDRGTIRAPLPASARPASGDGRVRTRWSRSSPTSPHGSPTTPTSGPARSTTRSWPWATRAPT